MSNQIASINTDEGRVDLSVQRYAYDGRWLYKIVPSNGDEPTYGFTSRDDAELGIAQHWGAACWDLVWNV